MTTSLRIHRYPLATAIHRTPEFAKKRLADFSVNVGLKCGHGCTYCSSGAVLRCHKAFQELGESPFRDGYAIVDPDLPAKIAAESKRIRKRGVVQLCTTVDAWCPAAQQFGLGRRCLEALLSEPGWIVRILTKNAAVATNSTSSKNIATACWWASALQARQARMQCWQSLNPTHPLFLSEWPF